MKRIYTQNLYKIRTCCGNFICLSIDSLYVCVCFMFFTLMEFRLSLCFSLIRFGAYIQFFHLYLVKEVDEIFRVSTVHWQWHRVFFWVFFFLLCHVAHFHSIVSCVWAEACICMFFIFVQRLLFTSGQSNSNFEVFLLPHLSRQTAAQGIIRIQTK